MHENVKMCTQFQTKTSNLYPPSGQNSKNLYPTLKFVAISDQNIEICTQF